MSKQQFYEPVVLQDFEPSVRVKSDNNGVDIKAEQELKIDKFIEQNRRRKNDEFILRQLLENNKKNKLRGNLAKKYDDPISQMLRDQKQVNISKLPTFYGQVLRSTVDPNYTAVNPEKEAKNAKRNKMLMGQTNDTEIDGDRPQSARTGFTGAMTAAATQISHGTSTRNMLERKQHEEVLEKIKKQ